MMMESITLLAKDPKQEKIWAQELKACCDQQMTLKVSLGSQDPSWQKILLIDHQLENLKDILSQVDRKKQVVFLLMPDPLKRLTSDVPRFPSLVLEDQVDDVLTLPFRTLEVISKVRSVDRILAWKEIASLNISLNQVIHQITQDFSFLERLQKAYLPKKFPPFFGFYGALRYLAGLRSGGDYCDLLESTDRQTASLILTDASSYGLSSSVLSMILRVATKITTQFMDDGSFQKILRNLYDEIALTLQGSDQLSFFYGIYSQKNSTLKFLHFGTILCLIGERGKPLQKISSQGPPWSLSDPWKQAQETICPWNSQSRLILCSEGVLEVLGHEQPFLDLCHQLHTRDPESFLNEIHYQLKMRLPGSDALPPRDCTCLVMDGASF